MRFATQAFRDGIRRVNGAPAVLIGVCAVTLLVALPLSIALRGMIETHLGHSLAAEAVATRADYGWWQEFLHQASGIGTTFTQSVMGFGAVLANLNDLVDNQPLAATITGVTAAWMLLWSFLTGGIIDRLARNRPVRSRDFFAACGAHVWRLLRLGILASLVYYLLFTVVYPAIFDMGYAWLTKDTTVERTAFLFRLLGYAMFGGLLVFFSVIFDYARIRIVIEDRRSAVVAVTAAARFVRRHAGTVIRLYLLNAAVFVTLAALYALLAPRVPGDGVALWTALLLGQLYLIGRHYVKLLFYASQGAFFQSALEHAAYTGPAVLAWPESPAVEAIINAEPTL